MANFSPQKVQWTYVHIFAICTSYVKWGGVFVVPWCCCRLCIVVHVCFTTAALEAAEILAYSSQHEYVYTRARLERPLVRRPSHVARVVTILQMPLPLLGDN